MTMSIAIMQTTTKKYGGTILYVYRGEHQVQMCLQATITKDLMTDATTLDRPNLIPVWFASPKNSTN